MGAQAKGSGSEIPTGNGPLMRNPLSARVTRRQLLKTSLLGIGGLAAATGGLTRLESLVAAQSGLGRWRRLAPKTAPSPRAGAAMAYDATRRATVLFSGAKDADTWTWDGITWTRQSPAMSPPARAGASFAYHPPTKTIVLFGGVIDRGDVLGDTWLWNGRTWSQAPGTGPVARSGASMAFDPVSNNLLLFSGFNPANFSLDDVWKWDGTSWIRLASTSPALAGASVAYSSAMGKLILFGGDPGRAKFGISGTTLAWDGAKWSVVSLSPSPQARWGAAMAALPDGGPILLYGGQGDDLSLLGDTWTLDGGWSNITAVPTPSPRANASLAPSPSSNSLILFGGQLSSGLTNETWALAP